MLTNSWRFDTLTRAALTTSMVLVRSNCYAVMLLTSLGESRECNTAVTSDSSDAI
jgi:hypothetical protein